MGYGMVNIVVTLVFHSNHVETHQTASCHWVFDAQKWNSHENLLVIIGFV
jgi:hypothetical protein